MEKWYEQVRMEPGNNYISSRIRLVRNCADQCFPNRLKGQDSLRLIETMRTRLEDIGAVEGETMSSCLLSDLPDAARDAMRERRVLNAGILQKKTPVGLMLSESEDISLVLNGDDHFRLQVLAPNSHLYELWEKAGRLDDYINERFSYAFDDRYGYLTSFPTNVGTGMRANIVVHLPALSTGKQFPNLMASMNRFGVTVRGVYGTGKENYGALYDVSNAKTLGMSEREILDLVSKVAAQLNSEENQIRRKSLESHRLEREDEAFKSYGLLKYARKLSLRDALSYLSQVIAGITDGIVRTEEPACLYRLYLGVQPSNLIAGATKPVDRDMLDAVRADYIREQLPELKEV